uniref:Tick transposon n=1 Tax=Rhipicephalus zambeziensis TaxID=60191 RepID=A0A224Z9U0_9ACAR
MIRRNTYHKKGMKEKDTLRLLQALVLSRVTYGLPYHSLHRSEESQVDALIRSAFKAALGLPISTPTERLLALGIHNSYVELSAAVLISQRNRLSATSAGSAILTRIGISPHPQHIDEELVDVAQEVRRQISFAPVPKNMHHEFHAERRNARVNWLRKQFGSASNVAYVDAASYDWQRRIITIVDNNMTLLTSASVRTTSATKAESTAIALTVNFQERKGESSVIPSDSHLFTRPPSGNGTEAIRTQTRSPPSVDLVPGTRRARRQ